MKFSKVGDRFVLEMNFDEANDLECMILPVAEKENIKLFKSDVKMQNGYVRGDKRLIRKIRELREDIDKAFHDMLKQEEV